MGKLKRKSYIAGRYSSSSSDMRTNTSSTAIWESLVRNERELTTRPDLEELARRLGKDPRNAIDHLVRSGYLVPLFKGSYYVRNPAEIRLHLTNHDPLELFADSARWKGLEPWYFGLHTALRLHGMTHEFRRWETVISGRVYRIGGIEILSRRFVIHKWNRALTTFGIIRLKRLPVSDPEKTVLDLAYHDYWRERQGHAPTGDWKTYLNSVDADKLKRYLARFPAYFRSGVRL